MIDAGAVLSQVDGQEGLPLRREKATSRPMSIQRFGVLLGSTVRVTRGATARDEGGARQAFAAIEQGPYSTSLEVAFRIARASVVPLDAVVQLPEARR